MALRLLVLFPRLLYQRKMSFGRRHVVEELLRRSTEAGPIRLSGQGWSDYDESVGLLTNIRRLMPEGCDAILWYKPLGQRKAGIGPLELPDQRGGVPAVAIYNEAWWPGNLAANECRLTRTTLVVHHHQVDAGQFGDTETHWMPHCASHSLFRPYARDWDKRDIACLVTGVLDREVYPLRWRLAALVRRKKIPGVILDHPGYRVVNEDAWRSQQIMYAQYLGRAKIVLACCSKYRYGLAKYPEAAMAGAAIAGDTAVDFDGTLNDHVCRLDVSMSDHELAVSVNEYLANEGELKFRAGRLSAAAEQHHATGIYVERLLARISQHVSDVSDRAA